MKKALKVCGITLPNQVIELDKLSVEYIGFIHYQNSKRHLTIDDISKLDIETNAQKVLVTVNAENKLLKKLALKLNCTYLQLHGDETPKKCNALKNQGYTIIKAFGIDSHFNFETLEEYCDNVDYFLFDYKGKKRGGNGKAFDWNKLLEYNYDTPYFLSGGISLTDLGKINKIKDIRCKAIDVNSGFEISPGIKDIVKVGEFIRAF